MGPKLACKPLRLNLGRWSLPRTQQSRSTEQTKTTENKPKTHLRGHSDGATAPSRRAKRIAASSESHVFAALCPVRRSSTLAAPRRICEAEQQKTTTAQQKQDKQNSNLHSRKKSTSNMNDNSNDSNKGEDSNSTHARRRTKTKANNEQSH